MTNLVVNNFVFIFSTYKIQINKIDILSFGILFIIKIFIIKLNLFTVFVIILYDEYRFGIPI